jgi:hypothetical protein
LKVPSATSSSMNAFSGSGNETCIFVMIASVTLSVLP